jgi:hypothetical protein
MVIEFTVPIEDETKASALMGIATSELGPGTPIGFQLLRSAQSEPKPPIHVDLLMTFSP